MQLILLFCRRGNIAPFQEASYLYRQQGGISIRQNYNAINEVSEKCLQ